jgi:hypothetical protein
MRRRLTLSTGFRSAISVPSDRRCRLCVYLLGAGETDPVRPLYPVSRLPWLMALVLVYSMELPEGSE